MSIRDYDTGELVCSCEADGGAGICAIHSPAAYVKQLEHWAKIEQRSADMKHRAMARYRVRQACVILAKALQQYFVIEIDNIIQQLQYAREPNATRMYLDITHSGLQRLSEFKTQIDKWASEADDFKQE